MVYLISYDISSDRLRNKVAKCLETYGTRVQFSIFECELLEKQYDEVYIKLKELLRGEENAGILFYPICRKCRKKRTEIGKTNEINWEEECIVI